MPAKSEAQRRLFAMVYAARKGDTSVNKLKGKAKKLYNSNISNKELRDFRKKSAEIVKEAISAGKLIPKKFKKLRNFYAKAYKTLRKKPFGKVVAHHVSRNAEMLPLELIPFTSGVPTTLAPMIKNEVVKPILRGLGPINRWMAKKSPYLAKRLWTPSSYSRVSKKILMKQIKSNPFSNRLRKTLMRQGG